MFEFSIPEEIVKFSDDELREYFQAAKEDFDLLYSSGDNSDIVLDRMTELADFIEEVHALTVKRTYADKIKRMVE